MKEGKKDEARALLQAALQNSSIDSGTYSDAVSIYLYGQMYKEAKEVFQRYKNQTGKDLRSDFTLDEIIDEERKYQYSIEKFSRGNVKIFKPKSWISFFIGCGFTLQPVRELKIFSDKLGLLRGEKEYFYPWQEIKAGIIIKRAAHNYGERKILELKTTGGSLQFEIAGGGYDYFADSGILVDELGKHIKIPVTHQRYRLWLWILVFIASAFLIGCIQSLACKSKNIYIRALVDPQTCSD